MPLSTYTEAYWKIDLHNLFRFIALRIDEHAQQEIREYAELIGREIVSRWCPMAWSAFDNYRIGGLALSRTEVAMVRVLSAGNTAEALKLARRAGWVSKGAEAKAISREGREAKARFTSLGIDVPWKIGSESDKAR